MCLIVYSNDHAPLTVRLIYSSSKLRTVQMMIFSLVAMIGLAKCCITSACLQWLCHSGERIVAPGPLVFCLSVCPSVCLAKYFTLYCMSLADQRCMGTSGEVNASSTVESQYDF